MGFSMLARERLVRNADVSQGRAQKTTQAAEVGLVVHGDRSLRRPPSILSGPLSSLLQRNKGDGHLVGRGHLKVPVERQTLQRDLRVQPRGDLPGNSEQAVRAEGARGHHDIPSA